MKLNTIKRTISVALVAVMLCITAGCTSAAGTEGQGMSSMLIIVPMIVVVYFLMIRPESKKKKQVEQMRSELAIGDTITTIGGMVGKVVNIKEDNLTFETGEDRVRVQIMKWAIQSTGKPDTQE